MNFSCQTPNCAIALSKLISLVKMNRPVCHKPMQLVVDATSISAEDQKLIANLPYVIAYPLKRALEEKHAWTKIESK